jgi:hypothetical protein
MKGMKSLKKLLILSTVILSTSLNAAYERHYQSLMCKPDEVFFIDPTSNYAKESMQFITDIYVTGEQIKTAIMEGSQAQIMEFNKQMTSLIDTMIGMDQAAFKDKLKQDSAMREKEMAYESNIAEEKVRQSKSVLYKDDTKEEMKLIVEHLKENADSPVTLIILGMVAKYDEGGEQIPIPIKAAEGVCDEEKIEDGYCSIMKNITPGKKLSKFFKACNDQKRELVRKETERDSQTASIVANAKKSNEVVNNVNAVAAQLDSAKEQLKGSCNVSDYLDKLCGQALSKEDFQEKVALNHIIPNGSVSPDNLLAPSFYGGSDLRKYDSATIQDLKDKALSKDEVQGENAEQSYVPIVYTYKNTNQYVTALQYVDNISGSFIVSNQDVEVRKLQSSADFQSLYAKRMAALSLVRASFMDAIKRRRGANISKEVATGGDMTISDEPTKESVLGASQYDILLNKVDSVFSSIAIKATAKLGESASTDEIANGSEKTFKKAQLDTLKLQTEIMFKSLMEDEKIELLKAAQISNLVNSPEMIRYLQMLRR